MLGSLSHDGISTNLTDSLSGAVSGLVKPAHFDTLEDFEHVGRSDLIDRSRTQIGEHQSFNEAVAREWLPLQKERLAPVTYAKAVWTLGLGYLLDAIASGGKLLEAIPAIGFAPDLRRARGRRAAHLYLAVTQRLDDGVQTCIH